MNWPVLTLLSLASVGPPATASAPTASEPPTAVEVSRAASLVDDDRGETTVLLLAPDRAWAPAGREGIEVCAAEARCAAVAQLWSCEAPACPFGFGTVYRLDHPIAELDALVTADEDTLVGLEADPSLRPLIAEVRAHRAASSPDDLLSGDTDPEPEPQPLPSPAPAADPLRVASDPPKPARAPRPPFTGWNGTVGWSFEATATPVLGVVFWGDDDARFGGGATMTLGFHHQFAMRPSRGPDTPKGAKRQRPFFVAWVGNNFGADLVVSAVQSRGGPTFGIAVELAARGVYNNFGDGHAKHRPSRLRVMSMIDHLVPMPGLRLDAHGTPGLDVRFGGPISILLRQRVGLEARVDLGFCKYGGPVEGYILLGVGVLARRQLRPRQRRPRPQPLQG